MYEFGTYLLAVLGEFGGGRGDPANAYVRFGLGIFFFGSLFVISLRNCREKQAGRETYLAIGFGFGLAREAFKFVIKSLEIHGGVETEVLELFFPPLEHTLFAISRVFIAAGFIYFLLDAKRMANRFAFIGVALICGYYLIVAPFWWSWVLETPTLKFSHVSADWIIHWFGAGLELFALVVFLMSNKKGRIVVSVAFAAFLMDDVLQLLNLATEEAHKAAFAPIRHNLHIWGIALLGFVYLREHTLERQRLEKTLTQEIEVKERQAAQIVESQARVDSAVRIAGIGHFSFDARTGECTYCSDQHAAHLGISAQDYVERTSGSKPELVNVHEDDRQIVLEAIDRLNAGEPRTFEYRAVLPNGEIRFIREIEEPVFDEDGVIVTHVGTSIDLTELKEAEIRLRQSQRIEALGTLTGGIAHDFNNLLAIILGNLELSLQDQQPEDWRDLIGEAITATNRGADLTKNLLSFARRAHLDSQRLNLNQSVQSTMIWANRVLPATIQVETSLLAELWDTELDATSLENALINVLLNARDAMPDGGTLTLETANVRIDDEFITERGEQLSPGRYVMLAVTDTGQGIAPEHLENIFEPFYTDKPIGQGSGLGLSMVQGFITQSGGAIRVYSEVGEGTTFKMYFQAATGAAVAPKTDVEDKIEPTHDGATILIAEDEEGVAAILKRVLTGAGYNVVSATTGDEALRLYQSAGSFDLLLTDIVMPGTLQGPALSKAIREIDPELPCIFMSGYASEATVHGNGLKPSDIRLMKPLKKQDLLRAVAIALTGTPKG